MRERERYRERERDIESEGERNNYMKEGGNLNGSKTLNFLNILWKKVTSFNIFSFIKNINKQS